MLQVWSHASYKFLWYIASACVWMDHWTWCLYHRNRWGRPSSCLYRIDLCEGPGVYLCWMNSGFDSNIVHRIKPEVVSCRLSNCWFMNSNFWLMKSDFYSWNRTPGSWTQASCSWTQTSGSWIRISGSWTQNFRFVNALRCNRNPSPSFRTTVAK